MTSFCISFCCAEIFRVSGMMSNQGFTDFDRLRHRSPSPMASPNHMSNLPGAGYGGGWNGLPPEVGSHFFYLCYSQCSFKFCVFCHCFYFICFVKEASFFHPRLF